jgi:hypothetical protein
MWLLLLACAPGDQASGASEPIQVREGSFQVGALPVDDTATTPSVLYAAGVGYVATQGQGNIGYDGLASTDAYSVAVALAGHGTGYWIVPVDGPDVTQDGNLLFDLVVDFGRDVDFGLQTLDFVAIDGQGAPGPRLSSTVCVLPDYADANFAECDPDSPPQDTVLSLRWDTEVDLDLVVVAPNGEVVRGKSPSTASEDDPDGTVVGELSRDSNANCDIDGMRIESLVFPEAPPEGEYAVYVDLYAACGEPSVNWDLTLYRRVANEDGTWSTATTELAYGALLSSQADRGAALGTYVTTLTLP